MTQKIRLRLSDCVEAMKAMEDAEVGGIVTDPPYL